MHNLLTIDAGNTNIVVGLYEKDRLISSWRIHTDRKKLIDEYIDLIDSLLQKKGIKPEEIDRVAISNVVPALRDMLESLVEKHFKCRAFWVGHTNKMNMTIKIDNPEELGADLIAAAAAAINDYGAPCIVIDFGTATTIMAVNEKSEFLGGTISPGLKVACDGFYHYAPHLPRVSLEIPPSVIGSNTADSLQAGIYLGYIRMIEGLIGDVKTVMGQNTRVVATGGLAEKFKQGSDILDITDPHLVPNGIKLLFEMNSEYYKTSKP